MHLSVRPAPLAERKSPFRAARREDATERLNAALKGSSVRRCGAICPAMQTEPEAGFAVFGYKEKKMTGVPVIFFFASSI